MDVCPGHWLEFRRLYASSLWTGLVFTGLGKVVTMFASNWFISRSINDPVTTNEVENVTSCGLYGSV
jgi:hypothetical protein